MKVAEKPGVTQKEIERLCDSIIMALENGPLDPDGLREATGKAVRNLGPEGQKKGLTTTLPVAPGKRTADKRPANGALDEIQRIVKRVRERWPEVEIWFRGDSDFSRDEIMTWCEQTEGVEYLFGQARNQRLEKLLAAESALAILSQPRKRSVVQISESRPVRFASIRRLPN